MSNQNLNITANFIDNASPGVQQLNDLMSEFGKGLLIGAVVAAGALLVDKFAELTKAAIDFGDQLNDMTEKTGIAVEGLSSIAYAAQLSGTTFEGAIGAMKKLGKAMEEARDPASDQAQIFDQLGIAVEDSSGKLRNADEVMGDLADAFKDMPAGVEKANLAMVLFGKSGVDMIPMLNSGKEGLAALKAEAEDFGLIWKPEQTKAAGDLNDNIDRIKKAVEGLFTRIAQALLPTLGAMAEALADSAREGGIMHGIFDMIIGVVKGIDFVMKPLILGVYILTNAFSQLGRILGGVAAATVQFLSGDMKGAKATIEGMGEDLKNTGQKLLDFHGKLYDTKPAADAAGEGADKAVPKIRKVGDTAKDVANEIAKYLDGLRKARDEIGANQEMKDQIELETKLLELKRKGASAGQITSTRNAAQEIIAEKNARQENWDAMQKQLDAEIKLRDVVKTTVTTTEDIKFENSIMFLSNEERKIAIELRKIELALVGSSKEEIARLTSERRKELELQQEQVKLSGLLAQTETRRIEDSQKNMLALTKALEEGTITEKLYLEGVQVEMERMGGKAKIVADEMSEFFKQAAKNIQNAMSDFLFDFMQGKMTDLGSSMKNMIDRMVANFLAAKAATALFGASAGTTGEIGGLVGSIFTGIAGARAGGGPVEAGKTYLVGEKRPELFTPTVNGTIIPDVNQQGGRAQSVTISISALDGADVMKVLGNNKKEIAQMVSSTNRTYNLRGV